MDFFYKPPSERPDECQELEKNYMTCLLQKAMKDRVMTNKCNMDSILWFHLECPQRSAQFDDEDTFKLKFRDLFAQNKLDSEVLGTEPSHMKKLRLEYDTNVGPDDIRLRSEVQDFMQEYKGLNPARNGPEEDVTELFSFDKGDMAPQE